MQYKLAFRTCHHIKTRVDFVFALLRPVHSGPAARAARALRQCLRDAHQRHEVPAQLLCEGAAAEDVLPLPGKFGAHLYTGGTPVFTDSPHLPRVHGRLPLIHTPACVPLIRPPPRTPAPPFPARPARSNGSYRHRAINTHLVLSARLRQTHTHLLLIHTHTPSQPPCRTRTSRPPTTAAASSTRTCSQVGEGRVDTCV